MSVPKRPPGRPPFIPIDGTVVTVRAARDDDGPKICRAFQNLDRDTVYTRFFGYKTATRVERSGDVAFLVDEDFQGRGIASSLMRHIIAIARANGLDRLEANVLKGSHELPRPHAEPPWGDRSGGNHSASGDCGKGPALRLAT
jgi:GNAT superfamily N-acetyltransferase